MRNNFKAWDKERGDWTMNVVLSPEGVILHQYANDITDTNQDRYELVFPVGRKDARGKEIFEGDIIEATIIEDSVETMGVVTYSEEDSAYGNKNEAGLTFLWRLTNIKIVGNVQEKPEFLKEGK